MQFRNHVITTTTTTRVTFDDGAWKEKTDVLVVNRPHHTAIVSTYKSTGLVIIEQNHPEGSPVKQNTIPLANAGPVSNTTMRSVKDDNGKMRQAKVTVTVKVPLTGQIWAYRPKPKGKK